MLATSNVIDVNLFGVCPSVCPMTQQGGSTDMTSVYLSIALRRPIHPLKWQLNVEKPDQCMEDCYNRHVKLLLLLCLTFPPVALLSKASEQ